MNISKLRRQGRARRHFRVRKKVAGTSSRPRLVVTRSARHIYAQVVDDQGQGNGGVTLASASTLDPTIRTSDGDKKSAAAAVGTLVAERAKGAGVESVVFDRGGNRYTGRIAALADAAREGGLKF